MHTENKTEIKTEISLSDAIAVLRQHLSLPHYKQTWKTELTTKFVQSFEKLHLRCGLKSIAEEAAESFIESFIKSA